MNSENSFVRTMPASLDPLFGIRESFFVHAPHSKVLSVARVCATDSLGAVYTMPPGGVGNHSAFMKQAIFTHASIAGADSTILVDANQYSGNGRKFASSALNPDWVKSQFDSGLKWATTNSGYVDRDDFAGLETLLNNAEDLASNVQGNILTLLPIEYTWLSSRADELRDLIDRRGLSVGLMLGATDDPLARKNALQGLLHVLESREHTALLRTDLSAVGALAGGASIAAFGITTSMRHIYPLSTDKGFARSTFPSSLVPQALSLHRVDTLARAIALSRDDLHWRCQCNRCYGRTIDWIIDSDDAFEHTLYGVADLIRNTISAQSVEESLKSWLAKCENAQFLHMEIEHSTHVGWKIPDFISAWRSLKRP